jgi:membrane-bound ClpP family serine protease
VLILRAFGGPRYDATLMRDFVLSRDVIYAVALYGAILAGVLAWLFLSKQKILARNGFNAICIAVRLGLLFAVLLWFCWFVGIAAALGIAAVAGFIALGVFMDLPVSGVVSFACLYIVQQFVLGFPARHERMLSPSDAPDQPNINDLIGAEGITASPLRPIGDVKIDGQNYRAKTTNGQMLEANRTVFVAFVQQGTLIVKPSPACPAES